MNASDLLAVWERGFGLSQLERPLDLLAVASGGSDERALSPSEIAELPVGRRDAELFALRRWMFGRDLQSAAECPACGERLEMSLDVDELIVSAPDATSTVIDIAGTRVECRAPSSADLIACAGGDAEAMRARLLERCVSSVRDANGADVSLPDDVAAAVVEAMVELDPQADVTLDLACPACDHRWQEPFDIASFLWTELDAWARTVVREVAALGVAYGWSERESLALSPMRRRIYMDLAGA